ncbi:MAG TPA: hypothetical protein VE222_05870 [Nitrospiraceae bacterium]|nr:hypothetical protein [Nitrospiraceae bacterium]
MPRSNAAVARELKKIRSSFRQLARSFTRIIPILIGRRKVATATEGGNDRRRRRALSPARRQALRLQGRYIGTIRMLPAAKKAKVKRVRDTKGVRAAIAYARRLAS